MAQFSVCDSREDLIGGIYEAAAMPELWPGVLQRLAAVAGLDGGILFTADESKVVRWTASDSMHPLVHTFIRDGWMMRNSRAAKLAPMQYPGFVTDLDLFTVEEMDHDPFYTDLLRPFGLGWGAGTLVPVPTGDILAFTVEGGFGPVRRGAVALLDSLRPHLARAALLSARLRLQRARNTVEVLQQIGLPAAVVLGDSRVLASNRLLEDLHQQIVFAAKDRIRIAHAGANARFLMMLSEIDSIKIADLPMSIPVPAMQDASALIIHLLPVRGAANDLLGGALAVLVVTPVVAPSAVSPQLLSGLFDLTPGEARLAALIGAGHPPREAAATLGIAEATARNVLKRVFSKTGVSRQSELAALLSVAAR